MNSFQNMVLGISIILLILCLIVIAYGLYSKTYQEAFPPVVADCPDYWVDKSDGDSSNCENIKSLGTMTNVCKGPMDFSTEKWLGAAGLDRKQAWAKMCKLQWDGVTNTKLPRDSYGDSDESDRKSWAKCTSINNDEDNSGDEGTGGGTGGGTGDDYGDTGEVTGGDTGEHDDAGNGIEGFLPFTQESLSKTATAVANI